MVKIVQDELTELMGGDNLQSLILMVILLLF
jgi:hypothetical protein